MAGIRPLLQNHGLLPTLPPPQKFGWYICRNLQVLDIGDAVQQYHLQPRSPSSTIYQQFGKWFYPVFLLSGNHSTLIFYPTLPGHTSPTSKKTTKQTDTKIHTLRHRQQIHPCEPAWAPMPAPIQRPTHVQLQHPPFFFQWCLLFYLLYHACPMNVSIPVWKISV